VMEDEKPIVHLSTGPGAFTAIGELLSITPPSFTGFEEDMIPGLKQFSEPITFTVDFRAPTSATIDGAQVTRHDGRGYPRKTKKAIRKDIAGRPLGRRERKRAHLIYTFPRAAMTWNYDEEGE